MIEGFGVPRTFLGLDARPFYAKPPGIHVHFFK
jgi:hypothetical protein